MPFDPLAIRRAFLPIGHFGLSQHSLPVAPESIARVPGLGDDPTLSGSSAATLRGPADSPLPPTVRALDEAGDDGRALWVFRVPGEVLVAG